MIISVEKVRQLVTLDGWTDEKIKMRLDAIESTIRAYTNNNFQVRGIRAVCTIIGGVLHSLDGAFEGFKAGGTVQISESRYNAGLHEIAAVDGTQMDVGDLTDENAVLVTAVEYPADVIACAVNLMEWEITNRGKVGIQSETLSRHSVTYFNMDDGNAVMGYPASLLGCLKPYRKARC